MRRKDILGAVVITGPDRRRHQAAALTQKDLAGTFASCIRIRKSDRRRFQGTWPAAPWPSPPGILRGRPAGDRSEQTAAPGSALTTLSTFDTLPPPPHSPGHPAGPRQPSSRSSVAWS